MKILIPVWLKISNSEKNTLDDLEYVLEELQEKIEDITFNASTDDHPLIEDIDIKVDQPIITK